jgi:hypothetical protein
MNRVQDWGGDVRALFGALLLALMLLGTTACSTTSGALAQAGEIASSNDPLLAATDTDEQILANAELILANAIELAVDAVESDILDPDSARGAQVRQARLTAYGAIVKAREAQQAGETRSVKQLALDALTSAEAFSVLVGSFNPG